MLLYIIIVARVPRTSVCIISNIYLNIKYILMEINVKDIPIAPYFKPFNIRNFFIVLSLL